MRANIRELKDHLSTYIHDARRGVEVVITSHGVPVAKLIPILAPETAAIPTRQQFIQELDNLRKTLEYGPSPAVSGQHIAAHKAKMSRESAKKSIKAVQKPGKLKTAMSDTVIKLRQEERY